jgi:hypothetical protein
MITSQRRAKMVTEISHGLLNGADLNIIRGGYTSSAACEGCTGAMALMDRTDLNITLQYPKNRTALYVGCEEGHWLLWPSWTGADLNMG